MTETSEQASLVRNQGTSPLPGYLTVREVAARLGVSRTSVYRYVWSDKLAAYMLGNVILVPIEDLRSFEHTTAIRGRAAKNVESVSFVPS